MNENKRNTKVNKGFLSSAQLIRACFDWSKYNYWDKKEEIMEQNFNKCKIGDRLWCIQLGDCEVVSITDIFITVQKLSDKDLRTVFYKQGKYNSHDENQSLFFSNPNIVPPVPIQKNKRKFWLWAFREKSDYDCIFSINAIFFDEMLRDTSGSKLEDLEDCEYIKLPHTEIEVEVDWL